MVPPTTGIMELNFFFSIESKIIPYSHQITITIIEMYTYVMRLASIWVVPFPNPSSV
jgi:hypothetical protein